MEPDHERLLRLVAEARERVGLAKQAAFIKATGLGKTTIHRFERGEALSDPTLRTISMAIGWTRDSAKAVLEGGEPTLAAPTDAGDSKRASDAWAELADKLPESFVNQLVNGKLFATDTYDLTVDGNVQLFALVIRNTDQEQRSPDQVKAETEAWARTQRELRRRPPVDTGSQRESGHD